MTYILTALDILRHPQRGDESDVREAVVCAIKALEKQIPKKVISIQRIAHNFETGECPYSHYKCEHIKPYNYEYEYTDYKCPMCNLLIEGEHLMFCGRCGQALDWGKQK